LVDTVHFAIRQILDRFGATGSLLCAVHCALTPLVLAALPSLGLGLWAHHGIEFGLVMFVTLLGLSSLIWGYRTHRVFRALKLLLVGLTILWMGIFLRPLHEAVVPHAITMTTGGILVATAHLLNLRLNRRCSVSGCAH
jgi:hypothetical protein